MDMLRHGAHVEVIGPENLRSVVATELRRALEQ